MTHTQLAAIDKISNEEMTNKLKGELTPKHSLCIRHVEEGEEEEEEADELCPIVHFRCHLP